MDLKELLSAAAYLIPAALLVLCIFLADKLKGARKVFPIVGIFLLAIPSMAGISSAVYRTAHCIAENTAEKRMDETIKYVRENEEAFTALSEYILSRYEGGEYGVAREGELQEARNVVFEKFRTVEIRPAAAGKADILFYGDGGGFADIRSAVIMIYTGDPDADLTHIAGSFYIYTETSPYVPAYTSDFHKDTL